MVRPLFVGLAAGIAAGLFFGEQTRVLEPAADGFVRLLQMAVLPYLTVSLITSIGTLQAGDLRRLGGRAGLFLIALWSLALGGAFLMPLTFPDRESASFFSTTLLEPTPPLGLIDMYIPANPFFALANNIVPAVVFFSIAVGIALMGVPQKQRLLDILAIAVDTLARVMGIVNRLTPFGVFAIAATTAGTLRVEQAGQLQIYLAGYGVLALLLALWILPGLVSALTPIPVREIFVTTRQPLVTATIAGDLFIVLPQLIAGCRSLSLKYGADPRHGGALPDVIIPLSFNFPHSGKLLSVSFVLFAAWFAGAPVDPARYLQLGLVSVVTLFGSINAAMPFLLDLFEVPADTFPLFIASGVINSRFGTLVAAMHTVAIALLGTCAVAGCVRWRPAAVARYIAVTAVAALAVVAGLRTVTGSLIDGDTHSADVLATMDVDRRVPAVILDTPPPAAPPASGSRLDAIAARGTLRVGYMSDALPYAYVDGRGHLVGLDVALMHQLAMELGVTLEFAPVARHDVLPPSGIATMLRDGRLDLLIGGVVVTTLRARTLPMSQSYLSETLAFVVRDADRGRFDSWDRIRAGGAMTIALPNVPYYIDMLQRELPAARLTKVWTAEELFAKDADAFALPAERGSAWTLRFPQYAVVIPGPKPIRVPLTFGLPPGDTAFTTFIDRWIELKRADGSIDAGYQYWILGRLRGAAEPRWSIIRNVLRWTP